MQVTVRVEYNGPIPVDEIETINRFMITDSIQTIGENTIAFVAECSTDLREWMDCEIHSLTVGGRPRTILIQALDDDATRQSGTLRQDDIGDCTGKV